MFRKKTNFIFLFYSTIMGRDFYDIYNIEHKEIEFFIKEREEEYLKKLNKKIQNADLMSELKQMKEKNVVDNNYELIELFCENFKTNLHIIFKKNKTKYNKNKNYSLNNLNDNFDIKVKNGVLFVSDIHADAERLKCIWYLFDKLKKEDKVEKIIFLGDYGDRGEYWLYTYFLLSAMTDFYIGDENDVIFIRGNHEDIKIAERYCGEKVWGVLIKKGELFCDIWDKMFLTGIININNKRIFCSHGALPIDIQGDFVEKDKYNCYYSNWNDISFNKTKIEYSPRGAGVLVPVTFINKIMKENNINICVHGHCHENKCAHLENERKIITVVSNDIYYQYGHPFLGSVYMITLNKNKDLCGTFIQISQQKNEKLSEKVYSLPRCFQTNISQGQNYVECNLEDFVRKNTN